MMRFTVITLEVASDSVMSAELTRAASELSEGGRYGVELVAACFRSTTLGRFPLFTFVFEVFDFPRLDDDDEVENGSTH